MLELIRRHLAALSRLAPVSVGFAAIMAAGAPGAQERNLDAKLIVSGASGQLGGLVVESLLDDWEIPAANLILVSRTPETLAEYAAMGASVRFGDFSQPESLDSAYAGGDRLLLISIGGGAGDRPALHGHAIDAAARAGVGLIAYTSYMNVDRFRDSLIGPDHRATEALLRDSGVAWTMLRNSIYANGIVDQAVAAIEAGEIVTHLPDARVGYVTREDCAAAAAAVLATRGHENRAYNITGPELIGPREIAALATEISGHPVELVALSTAQLSERLRNQGLSDAAIQGQLGFAAELASPFLAETTTAVADLTGHRARSVRELLEASRERLIAAGH
jgi:NAD(P)H dehydrogenase (quinone)